jgi:hypothetical protein
MTDVCENPNCHCQNEVGIVRDGRQFCSENCRPSAANQSDICHCGHAGCPSPAEIPRSHAGPDRP